jgi:hypothetical protein
MSEFVHREKTKLRSVAEKVSTRLTRLIGAHYGEVWPQYYVSEFPRSGGSWLANMLADYQRCARPGTSVFPIGCRAVIHNHWSFHPKLKRVVYLMRDGRDVAVSMYFYRLRVAQRPGASGHQKNAAIFRSVLGPGYDPDDTLRNLPGMIRYDYTHSAGAGRHNWASHVLEWRGREGETRPNIHYVRYEDLLTDPVTVVTGCLRHFNREDPDPRLVERSVQHFSMASLTGREAGQEDRSSFIRKGVAGDWKNHFTREAAQVFDELAGEALIRAGYEPDRSWVSSNDFPR